MLFEARVLARLYKYANGVHIEFYSVVSFKPKTLAHSSTHLNMALNKLFIAVLSILVVLPATLAGGRSCPKLSPVPIDANFLYKRQPSDGFYAAHSSGTDSGANSWTVRTMNKKAIAGKLKGCMSLRIKYEGKDMMYTPPSTCYAKTPSAHYCETGTSGPTAAALSSVGVQMPLTVAIVIVDTDNKTFLAVAFCNDGANYQWGIYTTNPSNRMVLSRSAKALSITKQELKENSQRKLQLARMKLTRGECSDSKLMAGVSAVKDGVGGLVGLGPPAPPQPAPQPQPPPQ